MVTHRKGEAGLREFVILGLLVSGLIIGLSAFYGDLMGNYNQNTTDFEYIEKSSEMAEEVNTIKVGAESANVAVAIFNVLSDAFGTIKLIFSSVTIVQSMFADMVSLIGLPVWFVNVIGAMIVAVIGFILLSVYLNRRV